MALARTNLTLPEELMREVDELAGPRGRSAFVAEAVAARVKRERLRKAMDAARGIFVGTPYHLTPDEPSPGCEHSDRKRPPRRGGYLLDSTVVIDCAIGYQPGLDVVRHLFAESAELYACEVVTCESLSRGGTEELRVIQALLDALEYVAADPDASERAAEHRRIAHESGAKESLGDALIAGLAWRLDATVVTRNARDFRRLGVPVLEYGE